MLNGLPVPIRDEDSAPFWEGCDREQLLLQYCDSCESPRWPPGPVCPSCRWVGHEWRPASGRGSVFSWVVVHVALHPAVHDQVPYAVALIELEEGVRLVATIEDCDLAQIAEAMTVQVRFDRTPAGSSLPAFVPVPGENA